MIFLLYKVHETWVVWSFNKTSINSNIRFLGSFYCSFMQKESFPYLIFHIRIFSYRDMRDLHLSLRWKKKKKKNFVASISIVRRKYASRSSYNAKTWYNCRQRENKTAPFAPFLSPPFHLGGWCRLRRIALYRDSKSDSESTSRASKCNRFPSRSVLLFIKNFEKRQSRKMK